jgi:hypothetical protein
MQKRQRIVCFPILFWDLFSDFMCDCTYTGILPFMREHKLPRELAKSLLLRLAARFLSNALICIKCMIEFFSVACHLSLLDDYFWLLSPFVSMPILEALTISPFTDPQARTVTSASAPPFYLHPECTSPAATSRSLPRLSGFAQKDAP